MSTNTRLTAESLFDAARRLAPLVKTDQAQLDSARELTPALSEAIVKSGLFRFWIPEELGGAQLDPLTALELIVAVSELDGSVGWNVMLSGAYGLFAGRLPLETAREIYGPPRSAVAGALHPGGQAVAVPGGYQVSGRWPFGSGSAQATWFLAQCILVDETGVQNQTPGRLPPMRLVFLPASRCQIHDTWYVSGLRGTGSHDYSAQNQEVPVEYAVDMHADQPTRPERLYACPALTLGRAAVSSVPLGIARNAVRRFIELAPTKRSIGSSVPLRENPVAQTSLARAHTLIRSAERTLFGAVGDLWRAVERGESPSIEQRAEVRMACIYAGESAARAVDIVYEMLGSTSIFEKDLIERCFRDVHAATQHLAMSWTGLETSGRVLLGLEPNGLL